MLSSRLEIHMYELFHRVVRFENVINYPCPNFMEDNF